MCVCVCLTSVLVDVTQWAGNGRETVPRPIPIYMGVKAGQYKRTFTGSLHFYGLDAATMPLRPSTECRKPSTSSLTLSLSLSFCKTFSLTLCRLRDRPFSSSLQRTGSLYHVLLRSTVTLNRSPVSSFCPLTRDLHPPPVCVAEASSMSTSSPPTPWFLCHVGNEKARAIYACHFRSLTSQRHRP